jgi:hypothetical protein
MRKRLQTLLYQTPTSTREIRGSQGDDNEDCSFPGYEYRVIWWLVTMVPVEHAASRITPPALPVSSIGMSSKHSNTLAQ